MNIFPRARFAVSLPHHIQQSPIHFCWLVTPPVPQKAIYFSQATREIPPVAIVGDFSPFLGVNKIKFQRPCFCLGEGRRTQQYRQGQQKAGQPVQPCGPKLRQDTLKFGHSVQIYWPCGLILVSPKPGSESRFKGARPQFLPLILMVNCSLLKSKYGNSVARFGLSQTVRKQGKQIPNTVMGLCRLTCRISSTPPGPDHGHFETLDRSYEAESNCSRSGRRNSGSIPYSLSLR